MRKLLMALACLLLSDSFLIGQVSVDAPCGFDQTNSAQLQSNSEYARRSSNFEQGQLDATALQPRAALLTIPLVVHLMHLPSDTVEGFDSNISNAQVEQQLEHLNDAFRHVNIFAGGPYYTNAGIASVDTEIEFCLATTDTAGNPTTGIVRYPTEYSNLAAYQFMPEGYTQEYALKLLSHWDCTKYFNIWVVNDICQYQGPPMTGCGLAGLSSFPPSHGYIEDGVVVEAYSFGTSANGSKVLVHEAGHYLGLYHTFQGGCGETNCLLHGDRVCDTPPDNSTGAASVGQPMNTCSNDSLVSNSPFTFNAQDIYENYMDYGNQSTWNTFTPDQKTRMRNSLLTTRASLLSSEGCALAAAAPLPVEWEHFSGTVEKRGILLNWETTAEENTAAFLVERSAEGGLFSAIAKVGAMGSAGKYAALDPQPLPGTNYYRLSVKDQDGSESFSPLIALQWRAQNKVEILSNLLKTNFLQVHLTASEECNAQLKILDARGCALLEEAFLMQAGSTHASLSIEGLPGGVYFLFTEMQGERQVIRFVKS